MLYSSDSFYQLEEQQIVRLVSKYQEAREGSIPVYTLMFLSY